MAEISRAALFGKLNPLMYKAVEGAVTFCKLRGNPRVELAHWLFQIVNLPDSDLHRIVRHFELDPSPAGGAICRPRWSGCRAGHGASRTSPSTCPRP